MIVVDNWIGKAISAIEKGPNWKSTAILLTWDDYGGFYDHVAPPATNGVRVPAICEAKLHRLDACNVCLNPGVLRACARTRAAQLRGRKRL